MCGGHALGEKPHDPLHNSYLRTFLHFDNIFFSKTEPTVLLKTRPWIIAESLGSSLYFIGLIKKNKQP